MGTSFGKAEPKTPARAYGGVSAEERALERRGRLLASGLELFGTHGYAATSIERLCVHSGVGTRHFYEAFSGREELLTAVFDEVIDAARLSVLEVLAQPVVDPRARVARGVDAFLRAYLDDPRRGRVACIEVVGVSEKLERHRRKVIHGFAEVIASESQRNADAGRLPQQSFELGSIAMAGAVNELIVEWLTREEPPPVAELTHEIVGLFLAILAGGWSAFDYREARRADKSVEPAGAGP